VLSAPVGSGWQFVAVTASPGALALRVNATSTSAVATATAASGLTLGGALDGALDEWALWERVLSESELDVLYSGGDGVGYDDLDTLGVHAPVRSTGGLYTGLVSHWPLDEDSGTRYDAHGRDNLEPTGSVPSTSGVDGMGAADLRQDVSLSTSYALAQGDEFAVAAWVYPRGCANTYCTVMGVWGDTSARAWRVRYQNSRFYADVYTLAGVVTLENPDASVGEWYAVGVWYDGTTCTLAVNDTTTSAPCTPATGTPLPALTLGDDRVSLYDNHVAAAVDMVSLWGRALTAAEWDEVALLLPYTQYGSLTGSNIVYLPMVSRNASAPVDLDACANVTCDAGFHCVAGECVEDDPISTIVPIDYEGTSWLEWAEMLDALLQPVRDLIDDIAGAIETIQGQACGHITPGDEFIVSNSVEIEFRDDQTTLERAYMLGLVIGRPVAYVRVLREYEVLGLNYLTLLVGFIFAAFLMIAFVTAFVITMRLLFGIADLLKWIYELIPLKST